MSVASGLVALGAAVLAAVPPVAAYEAVAVQDAGALTGTVRFVGVPPKLDPIPVSQNRDVCGEQKASEALVLGVDRGVKGSVILVEGVARGKKAAADLILDNRDCLFVAHVTAAGPGDRLRVTNSDPILHSVHGFVGTSTVFHLALPVKGQTIDMTKKLQKPGIVRVLCDTHPHMSAWLVVHDSPYVAVTDERGAFRIADIPPGTYKVTMWHAGFRRKGADRDRRRLYDAPRRITKQVAIAPGAAATVDFALR